MRSTISFLALALSFSVSCSSGDDSGSGTGGAPASTGGAPASTGGAPPSTGGVPATTGGIAATGGSVAATGGASNGGAPGGGTGGAAAGAAGKPGDGPADTSKAGIEAFLASKAYQSWKFDAAAPRDSMGLPTHGRVRVAINSTLEASIAAGADGDKAPFAAGSMAVKELYGAGDVLAGLAFMAKVAPENTTASWVWYCDGPVAQCGLSSDPVPYYASGTTLGACGFCHGNYFYIGIR
jgi:hypothetical protein